MELERMSATKVPMTITIDGKCLIESDMAISLKDAGYYVVVVGFGDECSVEGAGD